MEDALIKIHKRFHAMMFTTAVLAAGVMGCGSGGEVATEAFETLAELEEAQAALGSTEEGSNECFDGFQACMEEGDKETCKEELKGCLPEPPEDPPGLADEEGAGADGATGPGPDGEKGPGPDGEKGPGPDGEKGPGPDGEKCGKGKAKLKQGIGQCLEKLDSCLDTEATVKECVGKTKECVKKTLGSHFAKHCEKAKAKCATEDAPADICEKMAEKCAEGPKPPKKLVKKVQKAIDKIVEENKGDDSPEE